MMRQLPAFPEHVVDATDSLMQYLGWRCFVFTSLRPAGASFAARRLAPVDVAAMLSRTMKDFLRQVEAAPEDLHRAPYGQRSGMINRLHDAGIVEWHLKRVDRRASWRPRDCYRRRYYLTAVGQSVMRYVRGGA